MHSHHKSGIIEAQVEGRQICKLRQIVAGFTFRAQQNKGGVKLCEIINTTAQSRYQFL